MAFQTVFDNQLVARVAKDPLRSDLVDGIQCLLSGGTNDDALAGSQAIGLDDQRKVLVVFWIQYVSYTNLRANEKLPYSVRRHNH